MNRESLPTLSNARNTFNKIKWASDMHVPFVRYIAKSQPLSKIEYRQRTASIKQSLTCSKTK